MSDPIVHHYRPEMVDRVACGRVIEDDDRLVFGQADITCQECVAVAQRAADGCPGQGRCHGPVKWCPYCGTVNDVCDALRCAAHQRGEDIEVNA